VKGVDDKPLGIENSDHILGARLRELEDHKLKNRLSLILLEKLVLGLESSFPWLINSYFSFKASDHDSQVLFSRSKSANSKMSSIELLSSSHFSRPPHFALEQRHPLYLSTLTRRLVYAKY